MAGEFWLTGTQWGAIELFLPKNQPGARRTGDRRVISGIVHVLKKGCRWRNCPSVYGPPTTVYNRFCRWTIRGLWRRVFEALARADISPPDWRRRPAVAAGKRVMLKKVLIANSGVVAMRIARTLRRLGVPSEAFGQGQHHTTFAEGFASHLKTSAVPAGAA